MGRVAIPELRNRGYSDRVATGAIVAGGTLGILIPPSVTLIVYGIAAKVSIGQLFLGGVVPGVVMALLFCVWISIAVRVSSGAGQSARIPVTASGPSAARIDEPVNLSRNEGSGWGKKLARTARVLPFVALIGAILVALLFGVATPSETAAVGSFLALILVAVVYRSLSAQKLAVMALETTRQSTMIMLITAFSVVLGTVMSFLTVPQTAVELIESLELNRWLVFGLINIILLLLGLWLPPVAVILMTTPVLVPLVTSMDFGAIWFGVIMSINLEAALLTPPIGGNLFVVKGMAPDIPLGNIVRGSLPYVGVLAVGIALFCVFPELVVWLPNTLFSR